MTPETATRVAGRHPIAVRQVAAGTGAGCDGGKPTREEETPVADHPHEPPIWSGRPSEPPSNGFGMAALILGIIGVLTGLFPVLFWAAAVLGVIALVLGIAGARRARQGVASNPRMSATGAVLGALAIVLSVIGILIIADVFEDDEDDGDDGYSAPSLISAAPQHVEWNSPPTGSVSASRL